MKNGSWSDEVKKTFFILLRRPDHATFFAQLKDCENV